MKKDTIFLKEITIKDTTDNDVEVQIMIFKDIKSGGVFGIDSSFVEQVFDDEEVVKVNEPINNREVILDV